MKELAEQKLFLERTEIETVLSDKSLVEQGCFRFNKQVFMLNLFFRKIECNVANIGNLLEERNSKYKDSDHQLNRNLQTYDLMAKPKKHQYRLQSKTCNIVSMHPTVMKADLKLANQINDPSHMLDIHVEKEKLAKTDYQSYADILVFTRVSSTVWDDSINLTWESLISFFGFFGHSFDPIQTLKRGCFSSKEQFIFYNLIGECLTLDPLRQIELHFDLNKLSMEKILHDRFYLQLDQLFYEQVRSRLHFYYPDILRKRGLSIEPCIGSDTRKIVSFLGKQPGYEHFSERAVAFSVEQRTQAPKLSIFDPCDYDRLTFPFIQSASTIQRQTHINSIVKVYRAHVKSGLVEASDLEVSKPL